MYEFPFGGTLDRGRGLGLSVLFVQKGFWRDSVRDGGEVESPDVPTDYLRGINYDPKSQRRRTHLELWGEFPQLDQRFDLVSQHKLKTLEVVITSPVTMVYWSQAKEISHLRDFMRNPWVTHVADLCCPSFPSSYDQTSVFSSEVYAGQIHPRS